ncbi:hypothetical protein, partial [Klebsiella aerogenes]|uniref:hypothetical protein n=1 Tax=Klebsiella aerogenes TaxID=548 RepID=UPI0019686034
DAGQPFLGVKQGVVINDVHAAGSRLFLLVFLQPSAIHRRMQALKPKIKTAPTSGGCCACSSIRRQTGRRAG